MKAKAWLCAAVLAAGVPVLALAVDPAALSAPRFGKWGFELSGRDAKTGPGDDFFRYANGVYLDKTEIPPDRTRFGVFDALRELSEQRVRGILEEAPVTSQIGAYYRAYLDEARVEMLGTAPLEADLGRVRAVASHQDLAALMGENKGFGGALFGAGISPDEKDPNRYAVSLGTGGYTLPDRDYYLKDSFAPIKAKYQAYIAQMLEMGGWPDPQTRAADIVAYETRIAEASWTRAEMRDRDKTYNPVQAADLQSLGVGFDFKRFLAASDLGDVPRIILEDNTAIPRKAAIFAATPIETLKAWYAFTVIDGAASVLPARFVEAKFAFRSKTLEGQPEQQPRWKRAVNATNYALGEEVGKIYVAHYFPPESKRAMQELVDNLKAAFAARLTRLEWMGPETKKQAHDKLSNFGVKIGYPDKWRDYSSLVVDAGDLYGNVSRSRAYYWNYQRARLDKPVDRLEWGMTPQTVNAYYNSTLNEIVFPAAILQPPFFDPKADAAINYGAIGGVIGHEMSHGFDDQGRKSDATGRLRDWWTAEDAAKFEERAARLGAQYSAMELLPGEHINGQLTMGENIGDLGGLNVALEAYQMSLKGKSAPRLDGVTGVQRVFLAWAQVWRTKIRDEALRQQLYTDSHSPAQARVNGVVRNMDAWYDAFGVKPGDKLYVPPGDRVRIW
jgi:putative endopeptidase